jgi:hypothetical protein
MTARVSESILSTAPQQGQVTSKLGSRRATVRMIPQPGSARGEAQGKNAKDVEQLPAEKNHRHDDDQYGEGFAEAQAPFLVLEATGAEGEDVDSGKSKNQRPEDVVDLFASRNEHEDGGQRANRNFAQGRDARSQIVSMAESEQNRRASTGTKYGGKLHHKES